MNRYKKIYKKLEELGVFTVINDQSGYAKSEVPGFMDLFFDNLVKEHDLIIISLTHYFERNDNLYVDPDMQIRVFPEKKEAEAMTFRQDFPPVFHVVFPGPGETDVMLQKNLNTFLYKWLSSLITQGHGFSRPTQAS